MGCAAIQAISDIMRYCYRREILSDLRPSLVVLLCGVLYASLLDARRSRNGVVYGHLVLIWFTVKLALQPKVTGITALTESVGNSTLKYISCT